MRLLKNLFSDAIIVWPLIAASIYQWEYQDNAIAGLTFLSWLFGIAGVLGMLMSKGVAKESFSKGKKPKTSAHKYYCTITSLIEVILLASFGFGWFAIAWICAYLAGSMMDDELEKLIKSQS